MPRKLRALGWLHRGLGLFAALFVVVLAGTGILLNHTDALHLKQRPLHYPWLTQYYGIAAPHLYAAFAAGEHWVSQWDRHILLNTRPLVIPVTSELLGAWLINERLVVAMPEQITLMTAEGELIDTLAAPQPSRIQRAGIAGEVLVVELDSGDQRVTDAEFTVLHSSEEAPRTVRWPRREQLPEALRLAIEREYPGAGVTLERLLLDLHSGRLFGRAGVLLFDAVALIIIALALSGVGITWLRRWRQRANRRQ
ncbi:MAG: PepSY domain-containing protein [Thiotrichales bacterium]